MGLNVGELCAEQLLGTLDGQVLDDVDLFATAVIALAGIALGILVSKNAAHSLHHCRRNDVLGSDELDGAALAVELLTKSVCHLGIGLRYVLQCHANDSFDDCHFQRSGRVVYE